MSAPASRRVAFSLAAATALCVVALVHITHAARGGFRIDEAHKISETPFFSLWTHGDTSNPAWFENIVDRTNPPVGKYAFGASIALSGQRVPALPTLAAYSRNGYMPPTHPPALSGPYRPYLAATRRVSTIATALFAAIVAWIAVRTSGATASIVAVTLLLTNYLTQLLWATAVFDPLFTLFVSALFLAVVMATDRGATYRACAIAGVAGALAFQTRLNGAMFVALALLLISGYAMLKGERRRAALGLLIGAATAVIVTLVLNPYYWSTPRDGGASIDVYREHAHTLLKPLTRFRLQLQDIRRLLAPLDTGGASLSTSSAKTRFLFEIVFGDLAGLFLFFGSALGVLHFVLRWREQSESQRMAALWCVAATTLFIIWLPLAWPRYLLVVVPPLCYLAGEGYAAALSVVRSRLRKRPA